MSEKIEDLYKQLEEEPNESEEEEEESQTQK